MQQQPTANSRRTPRRHSRKWYRRRARRRFLFVFCIAAAVAGCGWLGFRAASALAAPAVKTASAAADGTGSLPAQASTAPTAEPTASPTPQPTPEPTPQWPQAVTDSSGLSTDEKLAWIADHASIYPEDEAEKAEGNPGLIDFLYAWQNDSPPSGLPITLTQTELSDRIPRLIQWDARWGYDAYGSSVIGVTGCGPTCLSMTIIGLTGNTDATPRALAAFSTEGGYYQSGVGTQWSLYPAAAEHYGLTCRQITVDEATYQQELQAGHVIISSMKPGHFTKVGHFIVIAGLTDGGYVVNDPNNVANCQQIWDFATLSDETKAAWTFAKQ